MLLPLPRLWRVSRPRLLLMLGFEYYLLQLLV